MGSVLIAYADHDSELATSRWRCFTPARGLKEAGHNVRLSHISRLHLQPIHKFDAVLAERILKPHDIRFIRGVNKACKIVFTFDDAYTNLPGYASVLRYWRGNDGSAIRDFRETMKLVDLNITPSLELNKLYGRGKLPFKLVPNFMSDERWGRVDLAAIKASTNNQAPVLGWGGSAYHWESWSMSGVADALKSIQAKYEIELRIYVAGISKNLEPLDARGVKYKRDFVGWIDWPEVLCTWDVSLAPAAGDYDLYRSNLRLVEAGLASIPYIASNYGPYKGEDSGGLLVDNTKDSWYRAIESAITGPGLGDDITKRGHEWASGYLMSRNVSVYEDILFG